ncbi:MAG: hypothetical protein HUJ30_01870 [Gammaproteobacteria bacterium]|nr:hypothetical protein [Gammaproteobacteria bacterium]
MLSNAVKYTEEGSINVHVYEDKDNGMLILKVSDTGIGIREEDRQKLFEPFERLESQLKIKSGGTGLGLYLTRKIVEGLLKGSIEVESELGVGSSFTVKLPNLLESYPANI